MLKNENLLFLPKGVQLKVYKNSIYVKGVLGLEKFDIYKERLPRFSLQKKIIGQSVGYTVRLIFKGVGYRVESLTSASIKIKLGLSHFISIPIPQTIRVVSPKKTTLVLKSCNLFILKSFVARLRQLGPVNLYKGKGILIKNELINLKQLKKK